MTAPGWYPDGDGERYWDGQQWTDQVREKERGLPKWAVLTWFIVCAVGAFGAWWFVLLMVTFGCDSGWEGCETVGITTVFVYAGLAAVGLIGLLIWALRKPTPGVKAAAAILMPVWVIAAVVLSFFGYWAMAAGRM